MTDTVNNQIPFVPENTTDPAAGLNQSLYVIDMLLNLSVESIGDNVPPSSPVNGARYIVGTSPTGGWTGQKNKLAMWIETGAYWAFRSVNFAFNKASGSFYVFDTAWNKYATTPGALGETNTASNSGTGVGIFYQKTGADLQFKSLKKGSGIVLDTSVTGEIGISAALSYASSQLSANVPLTTTSTWYDITSLSLTAGTWLITAQMTHVKSATTAETVYGRITDGTNHYASTQMYHASVSGIGVVLFMTCLVTISATTTIKTQASSSVGASTSNILAAITPNGSGNNATQMCAIKVA